MSGLRGVIGAINESWRALAALGFAVLVGMAARGLMDLPSDLKAQQAVNARQDTMIYANVRAISTVARRFDVWVCIQIAEGEGRSATPCTDDRQ